MRTLLHGIDYDTSPELPASQRLNEYSKVLDFRWLTRSNIRFNDQVSPGPGIRAGGCRRSSGNQERCDCSLTRATENPEPKFWTGGAGTVEIDTARSANEAVAADRVVDVYKLAGVKSPEISILSDEFLTRWLRRTSRIFRWGCCADC